MRNIFFLKSKLSGRPFILLESLDSSKQLYGDAKGLLLNALTSPHKRKFESIKRLANLSFSYNKDPFIFISEMQTIRDSFRSLQIAVDDVLQYFIWNAMNVTLQK